MASGIWQAAAYKHDIEAALRTPRLGGFQLLDLHDFSGQGTALVGVLDAFWDSKGYISAMEFARFSGTLAPAMLTLEVGDHALRIANHWEVYVYPAEIDISVPPNVIFTDDLDEALIALDGAPTLDGLVLRVHRGYAGPYACLAEVTVETVEHED